MAFTQDEQGRVVLLHGDDRIVLGPTREVAEAMSRFLVAMEHPLYLAASDADKLEDCLSPVQFPSPGKHYVSGLGAIRQALWILLRTARGELPGRPEYGCDLYKFALREATPELLAEVAETVGAAVRKWEDRIDLGNVTAAVDAGEPDLIHVAIDYTVRGTGTRAIFVFPLPLGEPKPAPALVT